MPAQQQHAETVGGQVVDASPAFRAVRRFVELVILPQQEGGYSAYVPSLPGIHSEGDDAVSAFANIEEALRGAIDCYTDAGEPVPWLSDDEVVPDTSQNHQCMWIEVE